jgi:hypothetical protein
MYREWHSKYVVRFFGCKNQAIIETRNPLFMIFIRPGKDKFQF